MHLHHLANSYTVLYHLFMQKQKQNNCVKELALPESSCPFDLRGGGGLSFTPNPLPMVNSSQGFHHVTNSMYSYLSTVLGTDFPIQQSPALHYAHYPPADKVMSTSPQRNI